MEAQKGLVTYLRSHCWICTQALLTPWPMLSPPGQSLRSRRQGGSLGSQKRWGQGPGWSSFSTTPSEAALPWKGLRSSTPSQSGFSRGSSEGIGVSLLMVQICSCSNWGFKMNFQEGCKCILGWPPEWLGGGGGSACLHRPLLLTISPLPLASCSPEAPPPPEPTWEEQQTSVLHLMGDNFRETLKKKKHTLVMFYAPCK